MEKNWRNYELVVIIGQDVAPSQVDVCIKSFSELIQKLDGKVVELEKCGLRSLAYEIQKNKRGYYVYYQMQMEPSKIKEIDSQLKFDKYVVRHLVVNVEEFGENYLVSNREETVDKSDTDKAVMPNYKDVYGLRKYTNIVSKILSRRITKLSMKMQKKVAKEISRARFLALMSYGP